MYCLRIMRMYKFGSRVQVVHGCSKAKESNPGRSLQNSWHILHVYNHTTLVGGNIVNGCSKVNEVSIFVILADTYYAITMSGRQHFIGSLRSCFLKHFTNRGC